MMPERYEIPIHTGTPEEVAQKLIEEAAYIRGWGFMREHAKRRELHRISKQLGQLGVDMLIGAEEDEGYILGVAEHRGDCRLNSNLAVCSCPSQYRAKINI